MKKFFFVSLVTSLTLLFSSFTFAASNDGKNTYYSKKHPSPTPSAISSSQMPTDLFVYNNTPTNVILHVTGTDFYDLIFAYDYDEITNPYRGGFVPLEFYKDDFRKTFIWSGSVGSHAIVDLDADYYGNFVIHIQ